MNAEESGTAEVHNILSH